MTTADVVTFIAAQRAPRRGSQVVRLEDGEAGRSVRTIKGRLATVLGLLDHLVARGDAGVPVNPVPHGMAARRAGTGSPRAGLRCCGHRERCGVSCSRPRSMR